MFYSFAQFYRAFTTILRNAFKSNSRKRIFNCMRDVPRNMRACILGFPDQIADYICNELKTQPGYDWTFVPSSNPGHRWNFKILFFQNGAFDGTICHQILNVPLPPDHALSKSVKDTLDSFRIAVINTIATMKPTESRSRNVLRRNLTRHQIKMVLLLWPSIINVICDIAMEYMNWSDLPTLNFHMNKEGGKLKFLINFSV